MNKATLIEFFSRFSSEPLVKKIKKAPTIGRNVTKAEGFGYPIKTNEGGG